MQKYEVFVCKPVYYYASKYRTNKQNLLYASMFSGNYTDCFNLTKLLLLIGLTHSWQLLNPLSLRIVLNRINHNVIEW